MTRTAAARGRSISCSADQTIDPTGDFACSKAYSENLPHLSCMPLVVPNLEGRVWMLNVWTSISPSAQSKLGLPGAAVVSLCVWRGPEALGCLWGPSNRGPYSNHGALRIRTHAQPPELARESAHARPARKKGRAGAHNAQAGSRKAGEAATRAVHGREYSITACCYVGRRGHA